MLFVFVLTVWELAFQSLFGKHSYKGEIMIRASIFPNKYIQGRDAINQVVDFVEPLGKSVLLLIDRNVRPFVESPIRSSLTAKDIKFEMTEFGGECTWAEIHRVAEITKRSTTEVIIGAGGGKTIDTAKAAAIQAGCRMLILPTTASTDAPTSALSVVYTEEGEFLEYYFLPRNPDVVVMDSRIVANAPVRFLVAGMGDALATWFEADAASKSGSKNMAGGLPTTAALQLARLCFDTLLEYGHAAVLAAQERAVTPALDKIIEANTLLSGLGFESGGLAAAHSIHNGLSELPQTHGYLHGEKVGFGTLTQLILENREMDLLETVLDFMVTVGLPITLEGIGLKDVSHEELRRVAEAATAPDETIHNEPFEVTAEDVVDAIIGADALGRSYIC